MPHGGTLNNENWGKFGQLCVNIRVDATGLFFAPQLGSRYHPVRWG
jgi:hypothetical protein